MYCYWIIKNCNHIIAYQHTYETIHLFLYWYANVWWTMYFCNMCSINDHASWLRLEDVAIGNIEIQFWKIVKLRSVKIQFTIWCFTNCKTLNPWIILFLFLTIYFIFIVLSLKTPFEVCSLLCSFTDENEFIADFFWVNICFCADFWFVAEFFGRNLVQCTEGVSV